MPKYGLEQQYWTINSAIQLMRKKKAFSKDSKYLDIATLISNGPTFKQLKNAGGRPTATYFEVIVSLQLKT